MPLAIPPEFDTQDGAADGVTLGSGTSFATPLVSGAAAWLATARPDLTNGQVADVLRRSARDVVRPGYDQASGFGLVQMRAALAHPTPERDVLEPNDAIALVDGTVFRTPDPYVWAGGGRRLLGGTADRVEDPLDVYRVRLPRRSRARIRVRPTFGNPDLYVFSSSARSVRERSKVVARSRRGARRVESLTITNRRRSARRYYVVVELGDDPAGTVNTAYRLAFQRIRLR